MTSEVPTQVIGYGNAKDLWDAIQQLFEIQSIAEMDYLRHVFQETRKNSSKMTNYLCIVKSNSYNLGQAGSLVPTERLLSQVFLGLDEEYNPITAVAQGKKSSISWADVQNELLMFEKRLDCQLPHKKLNMCLEIHGI